MIPDRWVMALTASALVAACGGGGVAGGALTDINGSSSAGAAASAPVDSSAGSPAGVTASKLELVDSQGKVLANPSLSQTESRFLKITAKNFQAFKRVDVTLDNGLAVISPQSGTLLTNDSGVALLAIAPAAVSANGVVKVSAKVSIDGGEVASTLDLQVSPGSVTLGGLAVSPTSLQVGQSATVSVTAFVNGVAARPGAVSVAFSSACGSVTPAAVPVGTAGLATAVIQTKLAGNCTALATTDAAAAPLSAPFAVANAAAFSLKFVKAEPSIIYLMDSVGTRTSMLTFKVADLNGNGVAGQKVNLSTVGAEMVNFCGLPTQAVLTGATGEVSFPVCSGSQPATVQLRAVLDGTAISAESNLLTVQSGVPSQRFFDLVSAQNNFYAGGYFTSQFSGLTVPITAFAADRQGNPVPDGTPVVFVTEGGQINSNGQSSCIISGGSCTVNLIGQDYRPMGSSVPGADRRPGRVTILAMANGEEHFIDANNNNKYDPGELFEDLGRPYLDKDEDRVFTPAYKNLVSGTDDGDSSYPMSSKAEDTKPCTGNANPGLSVANTCNQRWNGSGLDADGVQYAMTKVRRAITVVFSGGEIGYPNTQKLGICNHSWLPGSYDTTIPDIDRTELLGCSASGVLIRLADRNGNPLPADATLTVAVNKLDPDGTCVAAMAGGVTVIGNSTEPTLHQIVLTKCASGDSIDLSVTVNKARTTTFRVFVPAS